MKQYLIKIYLVVCTAATIVLFTLLMIKPTEPNTELNQKAYNDSILVSEYETGLDSFIKVNPKAADQFMKIIEKVNINEEK